MNIDRQIPIEYNPIYQSHDPDTAEADELLRKAQLVKEKIEGYQPRVKKQKARESK